MDDTSNHIVPFRTIPIQSLLRHHGMDRRNGGNGGNGAHIVLQHRITIDCGFQDFVPDITDVFPSPYLPCGVHLHADRQDEQLLLRCSILDRQEVSLLVDLSHRLTHVINGHLLRLLLPSIPCKQETCGRGKAKSWWKSARSIVTTSGAKHRKHSEIGPGRCVRHVEVMMMATVARQQGAKAKQETLRYLRREVPSPVGYHCLQPAWPPLSPCTPFLRRAKKG